MPMPALLTQPASGASVARACRPLQVRLRVGDVAADDRAPSRRRRTSTRGGELLVELDADDEPAVGEQALEARAADSLPRAGDDNAPIHGSSLVVDETV